MAPGTLASFSFLLAYTCSIGKTIGGSLKNSSAFERNTRLLLFRDLCGVLKEIEWWLLKIEYRDNSSRTAVEIISRERYRGLTDGLIFLRIDEFEKAPFFAREVTSLVLYTPLGARTRRVALCMPAPRKFMHFFSYVSSSLSLDFQLRCARKGSEEEEGFYLPFMPIGEEGPIDHFFLSRGCGFRAWN